MDGPSSRRIIPTTDPQQHSEARLASQPSPESFPLLRTDSKSATKEAQQHAEDHTENDHGGDGNEYPTAL